jgi:hypothetical protein
MRKPTGKGMSSSPITADYVQSAKTANPDAKYEAQKARKYIAKHANKPSSKVVSTSASVQDVKKRSGGRNRTERRGS